MAEVVFLTGVDNPVAFACRLLRKKSREGERMAVFGSPDVLARLDLALWSEWPLDFMAHLRLQGDAAPPADALRTPIWLLDRPEDGLACTSAVNLGAEAVEMFEGYDRVAEIVAADEAERRAGQARWVRYKGLGHTLIHRPQSA